MTPAHLALLAHIRAELQALDTGPLGDAFMAGFALLPCSALADVLAMLRRARMEAPMPSELRSVLRNVAAELARTVKESS